MTAVAETVARFEITLEAAARANARDYATTRSGKSVAVATTLASILEEIAAERAALEAGKAGVS